jgi:hypothetical protein
LSDTSKSMGSEPHAKPSRRRNPASIREAILAAARALMAERGPEAMTISDGAPSESWANFVATLEAFTKSGKTQEDIDPEMLGRILLGAPLVWSLWAYKTADGIADRRRAVGRFGREIERLLLFGVMKPEEWPDMVAGVATAPPLVDGAEEGEG